MSTIFKILKNSSKNWRIIGFIVPFTSLFSSCSVIFTSTTRATIKSSDPTAVISIYNEVDNKYDSLGTGQVNYRFDTKKESYILRVSGKGKRYKTIPILPSRFNFLKLVDLGIGAAAIGTSIILLKNTSTVSSMVTLANGIGISSIIGALISHSKIYDKYYETPSLDPMPVKDEKMGLISIERLGLKIDKYTEKHYDNLKKFKAGKTTYESEEKDKINKTNIDNYSYLNKLLEHYGFRDSSKILLSLYTSYKLTCDITKVIEHRVGTITCSEISTIWKIYLPYDEKPIFEKQFTSFSDWAYYNSVTEYAETHASAIENNLLDALSDKEFRNHLSKDKLYASDPKKKENIRLSIDSNYVKSVKDAVKSVVTIKTKKGHGSGCVIANDGFIITNQHVINDVDSTQKIYVITSDGKQYEAKIIRTNPVYDLALLKVNANFEKVFYVKKNSEVDIGEEVFAIGTPSGIELNQTISKGIISSIRKLDNKEIIQTDVSINPGNSGGALINNKGQLLGIVNAKIVGLGVEGIGFAIPSKYILEELNITY